MADGRVFRNLWGPQHQLARRHLTEQTSVTQGTTDADPTIRRVTGGEPYQLRWRDPTVGVVEANRAWVRKTLNSNDLGTANQPDTGWPAAGPYRAQSFTAAGYRLPRQPDGIITVQLETRERPVDSTVNTDADPTVHPSWQTANPYQLRFRDSTAGVVEANRAWSLDRLTSNDLGLPDADPTVRPLWQQSNPYQLRFRDSTAAVVEAMELWFRKTLNSNDLGVADADPTIRPLWAPANPHSLRFRDPTIGVVESNRAWQLDRLTSNDLGLADADPTIHAPWQQANPYQLRFRDPTVGAVEAMELWYRKTLNSNDLGLADADPTIRQPWAAANPYQLRTPPNDVPAIEAWAAQLHLWQASTPVSPSTDADPTVTRRATAPPYQLWSNPTSPAAHRMWAAPAEVDADPTVHPLWTAAHPYQLHRLPDTLRIAAVRGVPVPIVIQADIHGCVTASVTMGAAVGTAAELGEVTITVTGGAAAATVATRDTATTSVTFPTVDGSATSTVEEC